MSGSSETPVLTIDKDLEDLKDAHERLYREARQERARVGVGEENRRQLLEDIESLLERMHQLAQQITDVDQFNWLSEASTQWQSVYSEVFNIPKDVREKVGVDSVSKKLTPVPPPMSEGQIQSYLQRRANEISQSRKLTALYKQFEYLRHHRSVIHAVIRSSHEEMQRDWYDAQVYLVSEALAGKALAGKIDLTRDFEPSMFPYLEQVWLDDVKRLRAYRIWQQAGNGWDPCPERFYLEACEQLRKLLLDQSIKAPQAAFSWVREYLQTHYVTQARVRPGRKPTARELIRVKAYRLWQSREESGIAQDNWRDAEQYVKRYYENILSAVTDHSHTASRAVMEALRSHHSLVNAFEAGVCIFFMSPDAIRASCGDVRGLI